MPMILDLIVEWWNKPSPRWMQKASLWAMPTLAILITFCFCATAALIGPYLSSRAERWSFVNLLSNTRVGSLKPFDPRDTLPYAVFRAGAGGCLGVISLVIWWRRVNSKQKPKL